MGVDMAGADYIKVLEAVNDDLHAARHLAFAFPQNIADHPILDIGWNTGWLFGIHFANQYPALAGRLERALFDNDPDFAGASQGADRVAERLRLDVYPRKALSEDEQHQAWEQIAAKRVEDEVGLVQGEFWPLPKEYGGEYFGA